MKIAMHIQEPIFHELHKSMACHAWCNCIIKLLQVLSLEVVHILAKALETFGWMMFSVMEQRPNSVSAVTRGLAIITVDMARMLVLSVNVVWMGKACGILIG